MKDYAGLGINFHEVFASLEYPPGRMGVWFLLVLVETGDKTPSKTQVCWVQPVWKLGPQVQERNQKPFVDSSDILEKLKT